MIRAFHFSLLNLTQVRKGSNADDLSSIADAGQPVGEAQDGMSEEDRSLEEAIRLSMLDGDGGGAAADINTVEDSAAINALSSRMAQQSLSTNETTTTTSALPMPPPPVPPSATNATSENAAGAAGGAEEAEGTPTSSSAPPSEDHLPVGWESALSSEPPKGAAGSTRVQLRLASGKLVVRRFLVTDPIACLFASCVEAMPEARLTPFTLQTPIAAQVQHYYSFFFKYFYSSLPSF